MLKRLFVRKQSLFLAALATGFVTLLPACGQLQSTPSSDVTTVNLPQTNPKWQSIGNCWMYAVASWAESIALRDTNTALNISESYISYRHFEEQLAESWTTEINTGGSWNLAKYLMNTYGIMHEGDFIPSEADATFSKVQKAAVAALNESLKNGPLKDDRSPETIRAELDKAFGVRFDEFKDKIISTKKIIIGKDENGLPQTLARALSNWKEVDFEYDYLNAPKRKSQLPMTAKKLSPSRQEVLKRVKRALNAHEPVIMSWFVDFNGLDSEGAFSRKTLKKLGSGRQGWHMVVIEDYVVEGINPATGEKFKVGEGEASEAEKELAAEHGSIKYFVVKNSWGGSERTDRASYKRDGEGGYHKLDASYLFSWIAQTDEDSGEYQGATSVIGDFVIPARF